MNRLKLLVLPLVASLSACVAPVGPVEVTRFHVPDVAPLGKGAIAVEPAPGNDGTSLEFRAYALAVRQQLQRIGYGDAEGGAGDQVAVMKLSRIRAEPLRTRNPVNVGVGGSTGSYGSGIGLGVGIDLSGPPPAQVSTELAVTIRDRKSNEALWEGRASFTVSEKSPLADTALGAPKLAEALFRDFPGRSGETILVK